ncbi:hypothetical protein V6N13_095944 [Hibiscus sabdariffa]
MYQGPIGPAVPKAFAEWVESGPHGWSLGLVESCRTVGPSVFSPSSAGSNLVDPGGVCLSGPVRQETNQLSIGSPNRLDQLRGVTFPFP